MFWLLVNPERIRDKPAMRVAWFCYVGALLPAAFAIHWFFLLVAWGLIVTSACFLFVAVDPTIEKKRKKKDREYEPMMPLSQMPDENPPTVPPPAEPPEI